VQGRYAKGTGVDAGRTANALVGVEQNRVCDLAAVQRFGRAGSDTRRSPTESTHVGVIYTLGFNFGHADAGRRPAELSLVLGHTSHLTGPAPATDLAAN